MKPGDSTDDSNGYENFSDHENFDHKNLDHKNFGDHGQPYNVAPRLHVNCISNLAFMVSVK